MNTYYHYQGFVYGPSSKPQSWFYGEEHKFKEYALSLPKYKWRGQRLEDWKEMIEGKDFELDSPLYDLDKIEAIPVNQ